MISLKFTISIFMLILKVGTLGCFLIHFVANFNGVVITCVNLWLLFSIRFGLSLDRFYRFLPIHLLGK